MTYITAYFKSNAKNTCAMFMGQFYITDKCTGHEIFPCQHTSVLFHYVDQFTPLCITSFVCVCVCVCVHIYTNKKKPDTKGYDAPRVGSDHPGTERQIVGWPKSSFGIFYKML